MVRSSGVHSLRMSAEDQKSQTPDVRISELLQSPQPAAQEAVSLAFARLARVAPLSCDASSNMLVMAIDDSKRIPVVQTQFRFLMTSFEPTFFTVSSAELDSVLKRLSEPPPQKDPKPVEGKSKAVTEGKPSTIGKTSVTGKPPIGLKLPSGSASKASSMGFRAALSGSPASKGSSSSGGKFSLGLSGMSSHKSDESGDLPGYADMSRAFLGAVSLLVRKRLGDESQALASLQTIVRHCQLLASRVGLSPVAHDAVLAAAWLSGLSNPDEALNHLPTPYHLDAILKPPRDGSPVRVETRIIELVRAYQAMAERDASACRDVNKVRRALRTAVSAGEPEILEPFLGILMDEVFLSTLDRKAGIIMVVDPAEMASATLGPPLAADGYEVINAADAADAASKMAGKKPDLLLLAASLPNESGPSFCRRVKSDAATAGTPVVMLMDGTDEKLAAECLRAGAEDVLAKPVPLELLFLKIQRLIDTVGASPEKGAAASAGVSGSLADMAFTDMIQILSAGAKSVEIHMNSGDKEGCIYMQAGRIIHATAPDQQGEEAFYTLMTWHDGRFSMTTPTTFPESTIHTDAMGLLMEGAKRLDDIAEQASGK